MKKKYITEKKHSFTGFFKDIVGSPAFFWGIIAFFIFEAAWIAVSGAYPLFYDELYHLTFIDAYSNQLGPFIAHQDAATAFMGDITRTPSYLYHYLMSFPYRWAEPFVPEFYHHVVIMRLINIGLVVTGLVLFKKLFDEIKIPSFIRNTVLFFTISIPGFSFVAAHVNYDNLLFLLTPLSFLLTAKFIKKPSAAKLIFFAVFLAIGCLVKHTFAIIAVSLAIYLLIWIYRQQKNGYAIMQKLGLSLKLYPWFMQLSLVAVVVVSGFLAAERIGQNIIKYQSIAPSCYKVQSAESCSKSSNIARGEKLKSEASTKPNKTIFEYTIIWIASMTDSLFSSFNNNVGGRFERQPPLPVLIIFVWTSLAGGILLSIRHYKFIKKRLEPYTFVLFVPIAYLALTFAYNYNTFRALHVPAAVQGRYLLIIIPILILVGILAFQRTKIIGNNFKTVLLITTMVVFLQGGLVTYIIQSGPWWYEDKDAIIQTNEDARNILSPIIYR